MQKLLTLPLLLAAALFSLPAAAAPVAVNDTYTLAEDTAFSPNGGQPVNATMEGGVADLGGFSFVGNVFANNSGATGAPTVQGSRTAAGGFNGTAGLLVDVGHRPPRAANIRQCSGGFSRQFSLTSAGSVQLALRYRLRTVGVQSTNFFGTLFERYGEAVCTVNGTRQGTGTGNSLQRLVGPQTAGQTLDSGWQSASFTLSLAAGTHTLVLGALSNETTAADQFVEAIYDDITVTAVGGGTILANDTGITGAPDAELNTNVTHGTLTLQADGNFTYTPAANYSGTDSFTYLVTDSTGSSNIASVTLNITPVNDAPVAVADAYPGSEDTPLTIAAPGVLANDTDVEGGTLTAVVAAQPANGSVVVNSNGSFTYTPAANFSGVDTFTYRAVDSSGAQSAPGTVTITLSGTPDAPSGVADSYKVLRNVPLVITATTAAGNSTTVQFIQPAPETATGGTALPGDEWKYLDNGTDQGTAWRSGTFDDTAWKTGRGEFGYGDAADSRPEFTVIEDNATPGYLVSDTSRYVTSYFRKTFQITDRTRYSNVQISLLRDDEVVVWLNGQRLHADTDLLAAINGGTLSYTTAGSNASTNRESTHETITLPVGAGLLVDGANILAVELHQSTVSGGFSTSSDVSFDLGLSVTESSYLSVLANDVEPDGDAMTAALVTGPAHGGLTFNPNGTFTYTPDSGYTGTDSFTYTCSDGTTTSTPVTVTLSVITGPNQRPVVNADNFAATEDTGLTVAAAQGVLANDSDPEGDPMTAELVSAPAGGVFSLQPDGGFSYTPASNANGSVSFVYRARDSGNNLSANATATISIAPVNDAPVGTPDTYAGEPGVSLTQSGSGVLGNDTDIDSTVLTATVSSQPGQGSVVLNPAGSFTYTPNPGFSGTDTFTYTVSDGLLSSAPVTVTIVLNARPVQTADSYAATEDTQLTVPAAAGVLTNDTDPEGQPITAAIGALPLHGTVSLAPDGSFTYTPAPDYSGADSFSYTASDGVRTSLPAVVTLNVQSVNDAPSAGNDFYSVLTDTALSVPAAQGLLRNDADADSSSLSVQIVSAPAQGTLSLATDGSFTYTPAAGFSGQLTFSYRTGDGSLFSAPATVTLTVAAFSESVAISEIMYNPTGGTVTQEFIELHNYGQVAVDLSGWAFTSGVNFTIPPGILLAADGYLVIPADTAAFQAAYPGVTNVLASGWGATSSLKNSGETIRLQRPDTVADDGLSEVDQVDYEPEGDWARRQSETVGVNTGWRWNQGADGLGQSLQLRNVLISNNRGQNWGSAVPTPGAVNSLAAANLAPLILDVNHTPAVPGPADQVHVTCTLENESMSGLSARVWWRQSVASPGAFTSVTMQDDGLHRDGLAGDGTFGAALPAQTAGTIVEFYVDASDGALSRTWPAPALNAAGTASLAQDASANCFYQVESTAWTGPQPMYRLVMSRAEGDAFVATAYNKSEANDTDKNITVVFLRGSDADVRYQGGVRYRGAGSRGSGYRPHNWKMSLPEDADWEGWTAFNLNSLSAPVNVLSSRLIQAAGLPGEIGTPVAVRLNGNNRMDSTFNPSGVAVSGLYTHQTPLGREWADVMFPVNGGGNIYKKVRGSNMGWGLAQTSPGVPDIAGYLANGWSKQTNSTENLWNDLNTLISTARSATNGTPTPPTMNITALENVADLDQWARWWAFCVLVNHGETNLSNGVDDDYSLYVRPDNGKVMLLAHDFDTTFGAGDTPLSATSSIWHAYDTAFESEKSWSNPPIVRALHFNNKFVRKFKWNLRQLAQTLFTPAQFDATVDSVLGAGGWVSATERTRIKTFMNDRRNFILTQTPSAFTATTSLAVSNGYPTTTTATATGLSGAMDGAMTDQVLVNGVSVSVNNHDDNWSAGTAVSLKPGLNRVLIQALDETGAEIARRTVDIVFDDASTAAKGPVLTANETWTAAGGPYVLASGLTVNSGVKLTIEPGTSVYVTSGSITVAAGGCITVLGTAQAPIRISRAPGSAGSWGGILINGTGPESRLENVIIESNSAAAIHGQNGAVLSLDRITFGNTAVTYLSLDGCSFEVSNCTFPATSASFEPVHGTQGIAAGGRGIIRDCVFGKVSGYNDSFDFTGGNRPGPILRVLNCVFEGSDDDHLDLDSTDAWIEGNVFLHCHRNGASPDSSSGVSGGDDNGAKSEVTIIRNLFYDCDNAVTMKQGNSFALISNTIARITKTGGIDTASGVVNFADDGTTAGLGGWIAGNIITDVEGLTRNGGPGIALTFSGNLLPTAWTGSGSGNLVAADPLLNLSLITAPATATAAQVRAALQPQACSPAIGRGFGGYDLGAGFPAGAQVAGIPFSPTRSTSATLTVGPSGSSGTSAPFAWGYTHYRYALNGGTFGPETLVSVPISLTGLAAGTHRVSILGKDDAGTWQTVPSVSRAWTIDPAAPAVILSEILANNVSAWSVGTTRPDLIELHNPGTAAVDVSGYGLTDDAGQPAKFTLPSGTVIPAGGYLSIAADSLGSLSGEPHSFFGLDSGGETVSLFAPGAVAGSAPVDSVTFGPQVADFSIARAGASLAWGLATPTPGAANSAWCDFAPATGLRLNEWLAQNDYIVEGDFIEIANLQSKPVALGGLLLTDDALHIAALHAVSSSNVHAIAPLSFIPANGFVRFFADGDLTRGGDHLSFKLGSFHEHLGLATAEAVLIDSAIMSVPRRDVSEGRSPDSSQNTAFFALPTPGFSNTEDLAAETAIMSNLRVTELMFAPSGSGAEYIEFRNIGTAPLDVTGVHFISGITFTFPALTIPAGGYAVITNDVTRFNAQFPGVPATAWTSGRLANEGENIRIEVAGYELGIHDFDYSGEWYPETVGGGASLQIVSDTADRSTWGERESWQPGPPSPGAATGFGVIAGADRVILLPAAAVLDGAGYPGSFSPGAISYAWTVVSGPGTVSFTAPNATDTNATFSLPGIYELRLTATAPGPVTSSDTVRVTAQETFASWAGRVLASQSAGNQAAGADPDHDNLSNLAEYALGAQPLANDAGTAIQVVWSGDRLALRYTRSLSASATITGQLSSGLDAWSPSGVEDVSISTGAATETREARDQLPFTTEPRHFLRLQISSP